MNIEENLTITDETTNTNKRINATKERLSVNKVSYEEYFSTKNYQHVHCGDDSSADGDE